jgi:hypothetical protein
MITSLHAQGQEPQLQLAVVGLHVDPLLKWGRGARCMQSNASKVGAAACLSSRLLLSLLALTVFWSLFHSLGNGNIQFTTMMVLAGLELRVARNFITNG